MRSAIFRAAAAGVCLVLVGCGGGSSGGSSGGGGGSTANVPPSFTSPSAISFVESTSQTDTRAVVQLTASDPDSSSLSFNILAGKDASLFSFVNGPGRLAFNQAVSFETPRDANGDNVYEVNVSVSDGTATTRHTIRITITNDGENLSVRELATGLGQNAQLEYIEQTNQIFVVSRNGQVSTVDARTGAVTAHGLYQHGAGLVYDIVTDGNFTASNRFFAAYRDAPELRLQSIKLSDLSSTTVWLNPSSGYRNVTLGRRGNNVLVGLDEDADGAQFPNTPRGSITEISINGAIGDPATSVTTRSIGWGLRDPRLMISNNLQAWVID